MKTIDNFLLIVFLLLFGPGIRAQKADEATLSRLEIFGEAYSELRYFYPDDRYSVEEWDALLINGVQMVLKTDEHTFTDSLTAFFSRYLPFVLFRNSRKPPFGQSGKSHKSDYFMQHKGFTEDVGSITYASKLTNKELQGNTPALLHWFDEQMKLEKATIEISGEIRRPLKTGNLALGIEAFHMASGKDSVQVKTFEATSSWKSFAFSFQFDQGRCFVTLTAGLKGDGAVQLRKLQVRIKSNDSILAEESLRFNVSGASGLPRVSIRSPFGYTYVMDSIQEVLTIGKVKKQNPSWLFDAAPIGKRWKSVPVSANLYMIYPVSIREKEYRLQHKKQKAVTSPEPVIAYNQVVENKFASVIKIHGVIRYFFPYKQEVGLEQHTYLCRYLADVSKLDTERECVRLVDQMIAGLQDGHAYVDHPSKYSERCLEADFSMFGNQMRVIGSESHSFLKTGDIVLKVNGTDVRERLKEREEFRSGSPQWKQVRETLVFSCGDTSETDHYTIQRGNEILQFELKKQGYAGSTVVPGFAPVQFLPGGKLYLDLSRLSYTDFLKVVDSVASPAGWIIDLRKYPSMNPEFLGHFSRTGMRSATWKTPSLVMNHVLLYDTSGVWEILPKTPFLDPRNAVFLIGPETISYGESLTEIIDFYKLGTTIGETTAGANGNKTAFRVPGGYSVSFTGMKVERKTGAQLFALGIAPDVQFDPVWNDGKDMLVEYALRFLEEKK